MTKMRDFNRGEVFASWWLDAVEEFLSTAVSNFRVRITSPTTIDSPAGTGNSQSCVSVQGRLRFNTATVSRTHPGGAAGTYDVFVTAAEQNIVNSPQPNTDNTVYSYALAIVASGATPTIVAGTVDIFRKVAELTWDGTAITGVRQVVPPRSDAPIYPTAPIATFTPSRVRGAAGQTAPLTVWEDSSGGELATMGADGGLSLDGGLTAAGAGSFGGALSIGGALTIGGDVALSRSAANVLSLGGDAVDAGAYRQSGAGLASTHLADSGSLARVSAAASFTNLTSTGTFAHSGASVGFFGVAAVGRRTGWSITNVVADRTMNSDAFTLSELGNVVGTLVADLTALGLFGP